MVRKRTVNPFDKKIRGLEFYRKLSEFVEKKSDTRFEDLALFIRNAILEKNDKSSLSHELNRYDLIIQISVNTIFPKKMLIDADVECCTQIYNKSKTITVEDFLSSQIIQIKGENYTLQDFVLSIAYNGAIHWNPDNSPGKTDLKRLYYGFIYKFPDTSLTIAHDIARCLVESYKEIFNKYDGDNNGYSDIMSRQPMIVENGRLITDGSKQPSALFFKSYIQLPIRSQHNSGIRICLELQIKNLINHGFIFIYGNRHQDNIYISCEQNPKFLIIRTDSQKRNSLSQVVKVAITQEMCQKPFKLEVSLYSNGHFIIALNEYLKDVGSKIPTNFSIYDGKLIVGANLDGEKFGSFLCSAFSVEAIEPNNYVNSIFQSGLRQLLPVYNQELPPNLLKRPSLC